MSYSVLPESQGRFQMQFGTVIYLFLLSITLHEDSTTSTEMGRKCFYGSLLVNYLSLLSACSYVAQCTKAAEGGSLLDSLAELSNQLQITTMS